MSTPTTYADFLKMVKPSQLGPDGRFLGASQGVNYMIEGLTPREVWDHAQSVKTGGGWSDDNRSGAIGGDEAAAAYSQALLNPAWQPGVTDSGGFFGNAWRTVRPVATMAALAYGGGALAEGFGGAGVGVGEGIGSASGWNAAMDSQAANLGFGSAQAAIDAGAMPAAGGITASAGSVGAEMLANGTGPYAPDAPPSPWESDFPTAPDAPVTPDGPVGPPAPDGPVGPPAPEGPVGPPAPDVYGPPSSLANSPLTNFSDLVANHFIDPATGAINWANVIKGGAAAIGAIGAYQQAQQGNNGGANSGGYNGTVPTYSALRAAVPVPADYRPGGGGIRYLTDVAYNGNGAEGAAAQQAAVSNQQAGLAAQNQANVSSQNAASAAAKAQYQSTHGITSNGAPAGVPPGGNVAPAGGGSNTSSSTGTPGNQPSPGTSGTPSTPGGNPMPSTTNPNSAGHGDGMWVQGQYITKAELQNAFASGVNPVQYLQQHGVTDSSQIHDLVTQAQYIAGNYKTGDAALQQYFHQYQQYNPNGKWASDFEGWKKDQPPDVMNAMVNGNYTGSTATAQSDFAPGGIYGPGSAYYGQAGYGNGTGPRGMGDLGGGWGTPGAASGGNGQLSAAQQQAVMDAAAAGQPIPNFANGQASVTNADIKAFYQQHANDPAAIQAAMTQYHVSPQQAAAATGQNVSAFQAPISAAQIQAFYNQHRNDPAAIQQAMTQYGVTPEQAAAATGQNIRVFQPPASASAVNTQPAEAAPSSADIMGFYQQHANDPAAIQAAMAQYHVTPQQAAAATGQAVGVFQPQGALQSQSQPGGTGGGGNAPAQPAAPAPAISDADINSFYQQHQGDPAAIKAAMQQYGVTADRAASATGQNASAFQFARGGLTSLAAHSVGGQYLRGQTDGMADQIPAVIDHKQPAALAHGEFVWPADVVSDLGNGNSDAGAQVLHQAMDKIRMARHGTKQQGKRINPHAFMPGGLAKAYAAGGAVRHFDTGGATIAPPAGATSTSSTLSNWIAPYVTDMLGKGQALANTPYQQYPGQLTADATGLQNQAFNAAGNLQTPGVIGNAADSASIAANRAGNTNYAPNTFTAGDFTAPGVSQQFMSPYEDNVIQQQQRDAQRAADIATTYRQADQTKQGGFGGSRAAIMDSEAARNLALQKGDIATTGLQAAFSAGQNQFNTQQQNQLSNNQATEASRQFGANLGLQGLNTQINAANTAGNLGSLWNTTATNNINTQLGAGGVQQGITQAGLTADQNAFNAERQNPFNMLTFQQSLLNGLPLSTQNYNQTTNPLASAAGTAAGITSLINTFTGP